jgi:hypothetical protein
MKILLISIIGMALCNTINAQLQVGLKGGISVPELKGNNEQSKGYTSRLAVYAGVLGEFPMTRTVSIQPEINFSPQGGQRKGLQQIPADAISGITLPAGTNLYANFRSTTILDYIEIPVLAKFTFGNKLKYYACLGPHISFLVKAKTETSGTSLIYLDESGTTPLMKDGYPLPAISLDHTTDIKESIKNVNAGIQGGLGIQYFLGPGSIFVDGRAILGLIDIQTHPETDGKNKTGSLAVAMGFKTTLK